MRMILAYDKVHQNSIHTKGQVWTFETKAINYEDQEIKIASPI